MEHLANSLGETTVKWSSCMFDIFATLSFGNFQFYTRCIHTAIAFLLLLLVAVRVAFNLRVLGDHRSVHIIMVQGQIKKATALSAKSSTRTTNAGVTKKGLGQKNPKKTKLIKAAKINKKFTAGLTAQTEKMLGERAGHLEMIGKGRNKGGQKNNVSVKRDGVKRTSEKS